MTSDLEQTGDTTARGDEPVYTILCIDDSEADIELLRSYLLQADWRLQVESVSSIAAGVERLSQGGIDVVLLDYMLDSGMLGPEHIGEMRTACNTPELPVVVMTGFSDEQKAIEAFKEGAADYLSKNSVTPGTVYRAVMNSIAKARMQQELSHSQQLLLVSNRQLRDSNQKLKSFCQNVSQELRSPLASAKEFTSMLLNGADSTVRGDQRKWLEYTQRCLVSLGSRIDDLLDTGAFENGKLSLDIKCTDISELLLHCDRCYQLQAREKDVSLSFSAPANLPLVDCDAMRIEQLISNLISNGINFTPAGGAVRVVLAVDASRKMVSIVVKDTGCGIPTHLCQSIFQRFTQMTAPGSDGGMGVGLYLCKTIVDMHHGDISVHSVLGRGSEFTVQIPVQYVAANPSPRAIHVRVADASPDTAEQREPADAQQKLDAPPTIM